MAREGKPSSPGYITVSAEESAYDGLQSVQKTTKSRIVATEKYRSSSSFLI